MELNSHSHFPAELWGLDAREQAMLTVVEQRMWDTVARLGPHPDLYVAMLAALDGVPLQTGFTGHDDARQLHLAIRELLDADIESRVVHYVVLDSFRVASVIWEAFQDGYEAGAASRAIGC